MPDLYGHLTPQGVLNGSLQTIVYANNYNDLINKPSINSVELQGNKTAADLGLLTAGDIPVDSVNGKQGVVILDGDDIEYSAGVSLSDQIDNVAAAIPSVPVLSVNSKTGAVVLDGDDIEYEAGTSVNSKITDLEAEIGSGPVISVNGQQGVVELYGTDINYSLTKTLNQKIDEVAASIPVVSYPVTSVNTKTGDVVLDGDDIDYAEGVTVNDQIGSNTADIGTNAANIGDLSQLTTSDKSSLVGAVNEAVGAKRLYINTTYQNDLNTGVTLSETIANFRYLRVTLGASSFDNWNLAYVLIPHMRDTTISGYYPFVTNGQAGKWIRLSVSLGAPTTLTVITSSEASVGVYEVVGIY